MRESRLPEPLRRASSVSRDRPRRRRPASNASTTCARASIDARYVLRHAAVPAGRLAKAFDRLTGRHVYRLPWYLVVGSGGAGKTRRAVSMADLNCRSPSRPRAPPAGAWNRLTQCDWWFSNDAVLVDTPGAYLDAADAADAAQRGMGRTAGAARAHIARASRVNGVRPRRSASDDLAGTRTKPGAQLMQRGCASLCN